MRLSRMRSTAERSYSLSFLLRSHSPLSLHTRRTAHLLSVVEVHAPTRHLKVQASSSLQYDQRGPVQLRQSTGGARRAPGGPQERSRGAACSSPLRPENPAGQRVGRGPAGGLCTLSGWLCGQRGVRCRLVERGLLRRQALPSAAGAPRSATSTPLRPAGHALGPGLGFLADGGRMGGKQDDKGLCSVPHTESPSPAFAAEPGR